MQILRKELNYSKQKSFSMLGAALFVVMVLWSMSLSAQKAYTISSGNNYLAHRYNTTTSGYELYTTTVFSNSCVWYSPNTNNYYFMSNDGSTLYYLSAAFATTATADGAYATNHAYGAGAPLTIVAADDAVRALLGSNTSNYYFYNWDWGLAHGQQYEGGSCPSEFNSEGSECWRAYWLVYDNALGGSEPRWHMSTTSSYEPLEHIATFEPVRIIHHQVTAGAQTGGLSAISVGAITYGSSITPTATIGNYSDQITPEYTSLATGALDNCRGDWTVRVCDTIWTTHNFWPSMSYTNDRGTGVPPAVEHDYTLSDLTSSSYRWTLSGAGTAYLTINNETTATPTVKYSTSCYDASGSTATLTLTITWPDGSTQSATTVITIPQHLENPTAMTVAPSTMELVEGGAAGELELTFTPTEHVNTTVNSVSEATAIATASGTTVTPVSVGQTTVTVTSAVAPTVNGRVTVLVRPAAPTISYTMSNDQALVTLTNNSTQCTDGQLQYKTGSGDWTNYSAAFLVNSGVEITARLLCTSCISCGSGITSPEVKESPRVTSGVRGSYVILNDYEDHAWSYYSDPLCPIRSLNPVDVKITYYGNGTNNMTSTDVADNPTTFNANATGVKVGIATGEDQSVFVYYKTLERADGGTESYTSKSQATGDAEYTTIPNPFQVRPVYGTGNTKYRGFYAWRVKAKSASLTIKNAATPTTTYAVGGIIPAETKILFSTANEYGDTVEFEALWARAYVVTSNTTSGMDNGVSYERNFMVLTGSNNVNPAQSNGYAYTLSSVYPNGTSNGTTTTTTKGSTTVRGGTQTSVYYNRRNYYYRPINLSAPLKLEYITFNGDGSVTSNTTSRTILTTNNNDFVVGRGVTGTLFEVRGFDDGTSSAVNKTVRLESGVYARLILLADVNAFYSNGNRATFSNTVTTRGILGCDYDRAPATPNNTNLIIAAEDGDYNPSNKLGQIYGADWCDFSSQNNKDNLTFDWAIKSGTFNNGNNPVNGSADYSIYFGAASSLEYIGKRRMTVEGGVLTNIAGSLNAPNASGGSNYDNNYTTGNDKDNVTIRMKNGTVKGSIYGAAAFAGAKGGRSLIFTGGQIDGWIAGGANGTRTSGGEMYGDSYIYVGGNTQVGYGTGGTHVGGNSDYSENGTNYYGVNGAEGGNVFGAGCGIRPTNNNHTTTYNSYKTGTVGRVNNSTVVVADNSTVCGDVYGGGNYGWVRDNGTSTIRILGGTVKGKVFGGSNNQRGQTVDILMRGGSVLGGVYGGSNTWGYINDEITVKVEGGTVGSETQYANVHGGGYGQNTITRDNVTVTIGHTDTTRSNWPTIYGDVYGGSALGSVNGGTVSETGTGNNANATLNANYSSSQYTKVTVNNGLIISSSNPTDLGNGAFEGTGSVYGGGLGNGSVASNVYGGTVKVTVNGGTMNRTFGANNRNGLPYGSVETEITSGTIGNVYGGGNAAAYGDQTNNTTPKVTMTGGTVLHDVFGGGLGANARVTRDTRVDIKGTSVVNGNVFGGGSEAEVGNSGANHNTLVNILGSARVDGNVYGGGNRAKVWGNTVVNIGE